MRPSRSSTRSALIAGGGIGGLTVAVALARSGWDVTVLEQANKFAEVGAGLQLSPNASRLLDRLGILEGLRSRAVQTTAAIMRDGASGRELYRAELGEKCLRRWGAPYLHVHRADFVEALVAACHREGVNLRSGVSVVGWEDDASGLLTRTTVGEIAADLLVAADGVRSTLRARMPDTVEPNFAGQVAWRAILPADALQGVLEPNVTVWVGPGRHLVCYLLRAGELINLVGVEETPSWTEEGWSLTGDAESLRSSFKNWHPEVVTLLDAVQAPMKWGLFERAAPRSWSMGRCVLLGDACHPMLPFMAQGAAMAVEDAAVLAAVLSDGQLGSLEDRLARYEQIRRPRTTRVQKASRANGRLFHLPGSVLKSVTYGTISITSRVIPALAASRLDWLYGHDATEGLQGAAE